MAHRRTTTRLEDLFRDPHTEHHDRDVSPKSADAVAAAAATVVHVHADTDAFDVVIRNNERFHADSHKSTPTPSDFSACLLIAGSPIVGSLKSSSLNAVPPFLRSHSVDCTATSSTPLGRRHGTSTAATASGRLGAIAARQTPASSQSMDDHRMAAAFQRGAGGAGGGNVRRWSQTMSSRAAMLKSGRQTIRERTIQCMPSRQNGVNVLADGVERHDEAASGGGSGTLLTRSAASAAAADGDGAAAAEEDGGGDVGDADDSGCRGGGGEIERLTQEIEQHEHLMDLTAQSEQQRM